MSPHLNDSFDYIFTLLWMLFINKSNNFNMKLSYYLKIKKTKHWLHLLWINVIDPTLIPFQ
jgi:hypothetical protein